MYIRKKEALRSLVLFGACVAVIGCGEAEFGDQGAEEATQPDGKSDSSVDEECAADKAIAMPPQADWTTSCSDTIVRTLSSERLGTATGTVNVGLRCDDLSGPELRAVEHFIAYYDDLDSFLNEFSWANDGDGIPLKYQVDVHDEGMVSIIEGPNAMKLTTIFDESGEPLLVFEHGDLSRLTAYCSQGSEPTESPTNACFHQMVNDMRQGDDATGDEGLTNLEETEDDYSVLTVAARQFTAEFDLEPTDEFNYELTKWEEGAEVTLWAEGVDEQTYHVVDYYQGWKVLARGNAEGNTLMCDE